MATGIAKFLLLKVVAAEEEDDDDEIVGDDWMKNTLKFEDNNPKLAKDANTKVSNITWRVGSYGMLKGQCHEKSCKTETVRR